MKSIRNLLCLLLAVLLIGGAAVPAALATGESFLTITKLGSYAQVTACNGSAVGLIDIPDQYDGVPVTEIAESAFASTAKITQVNIPETVTKVGKYAFEDCANLHTVRFAGDLCTLGTGAFRMCLALLSVQLPSELAGIPESAFADCTSLKSLALPSTVRIIGREAFCNCSALTAVTIPAAATQIDPNAFLGCSSVQNFEVESGNSEFKAVDGCLCSMDGTLFKQYPAGRTATSYTVPNGVTKLEDGAFSACTALQTVNLPESLTDIADYAFSGCTSLRSITLPPQTQTLGSQAFGDCAALKTITLPAAVRVFDGAFYRSGVEQVVLTNGMTKISARAFQKCEKLTSVVIPASVKTIEIGAFDGCTALTELRLDRSVTDIHEKAFINCPNLTLLVREGSAAHTFALTNNIPFRLLPAGHGAVTAMQILTPPDKTDYYYKRTLETAGLTLLVTYEDGETEVIDKDFTCDPTYFTEVGSKTVTVTYGDLTDTFQVSVSYSLLQILIRIFLLGFLWY
ncbi:MAG: leucine-rich repeat protein [Clostridia bacterium]|nr:leucine-rich repeat protein [Clostridia bacterium]